LFGTVVEISALGLIGSPQYESYQETDYPDINFCYLYSLIMMGYCLNPEAPKLNTQCDLLNEDSLREAVANK
jgi:hypothetical protein